MRRGRWIRPELIIVLILALPAAVLAGRLTITPQQMAVIQNPELGNDTRLLVGFEVPAVLSDGRIEFAVMEFRAAVSRPDTADAVMIEAFLLTTDWDEGSVEWMGTWETPGGDFDRSVHAVWTAVLGDTSLVRLDLTDMATTWAEGESENHGVLIAVGSGERGTFVPHCVVSQAGSPPRLTLWYTPRRE
jgi:hypothetical protein